jgi:type IV pilus assembly protein PilO
MANLYPRTQREQLMVLVAIVGLASAGLFWYLKYDPRTVELDLLEERIVKIDDANQKAKAELAKGTVNELREEAQTLAANLQLMRQLVPEGNEVPVLLEQISTAARRVGLDIGSVEPLGVEQGADFDAYRYRLRLSGTYHAIADFLTNVGSLPRIVAPMNVTMGVATVTNARAGVAPPTATASFELHTYVARTGIPAVGGGQ